MCGWKIKNEEEKSASCQVEKPGTAKPIFLRRGELDYTPVECTFKSSDMVKLLFVAMFAASATSHHNSDDISGSIAFESDFSLSWSLKDATSEGKGTIEFTLEWGGKYDWAAFGLHEKPGSGMPNAEIFMCNPSGNTLAGENNQFCQVRDSADGYAMPKLSASQYITLVSSSRNQSQGTARAVFSRPVAANNSSRLSFPIGFNITMGLIYARGAWQGDPMPKGTPTKHTDSAGRSSVNFFDSPPQPSPTPAPTPPAKKAGVWPDQFDANMTIAMSQAVKNNHTLATGLRARLRYDFPARSQLWEYFDVETRAPMGGELWVGEMLYSFDQSGDCQASNMTFDIIRPDWLQGTHYVTSNFLLRQPVSKFQNTRPGCNFSDYMLSDLYKLPNTLGMTNSWLVADSPIAEPVRLEGPDDFDKPSWRSILEYHDFSPISSFGSGVFDVPAACKKYVALLESQDAAQLPLYRGDSHMAFFWNLKKASTRWVRV